MAKKIKFVRGGNYMSERFEPGQVIAPDAIPPSVLKIYLANGAAVEIDMPDESPAPAEQK